MATATTYLKEVPVKGQQILVNATVAEGVERIIPVTLREITDDLAVMVRGSGPMPRLHIYDCFVAEVDSRFRRLAGSDYLIVYVSEHPYRDPGGYDISV